MRTPITKIALLILLAALLFSVSSFAGMERTTDAKLFRLELELDPAQPVVGTNAVILIVTDARSSSAVDDAMIEVVPWMTMHGHGSSKKTTINKMGNGRYRVENIYYTMEGDWDLLVTVQKGDTRDAAVFPIVHVKKK